MLKIGIVGLPNVGKSSLFSLLTKSDSVLIANYPFATIEPHVGVALLPDSRIESLGRLFPRAKKIAPPVRFWDIAGLVREAHKGAGLGNSFLSNIREADAIIHVVRSFVNEKIIHVEGVVSPLDDWETIRLELLFRDRETIRVAKEKLARDRSPEGTAKKRLLERILARIESRMEFDKEKATPEERELLDGLDLLSRKPKVVLFNVAAESFSESASNESIRRLTSRLESEGIPFLFLAVEFELMIRDEEPAAAAALRSEFGIGTESLDRLIRISYELLDQATFFTAGDKEIRG
nr:ribosome-binding ATPase YchF-like [Lytechinus pictus]